MTVKTKMKFSQFLGNGSHLKLGYDKTASGAKLLEGGVCAPQIFTVVDQRSRSHMAKT